MILKIYCSPSALISAEESTVRVVLNHTKHQKKRKNCEPDNDDW